MDAFKKICKALLFPHLAVMIPLVPVSAFCLVYSMVFIGTESVPAYISYVVSAYTLTVWCVKIPILVRGIKNFKNENKLARAWFGNARLRVGISLSGALVWNTAYAVFQIFLGIYHSTFWYCSLGIYYLSLAVMRFFLANHLKKYRPGEKMFSELKKYRACGWAFLFVNLALTVIIIFMIYWNRTFVHHQITAIAMAAYTFTSFTMGIVNMVKYRKYQSPIFSASKTISLASACVSMLTLETTMLTAFGQESTDLFTRRLMLALSGGAISIFIVAMAIYMIAHGTKEIRKLKEMQEEKFNG